MLHNGRGFYFKRGGIYLISLIGLFIFIGILTTTKPVYRFSFETITRWTSDIDSSSFLYLIGMENRAYQQAYPKDQEMPKLSATLFRIITNIKPNDPKSLLGHELPGFNSFGNQIIIAGEGTNYANLSIESSPPLEDVLKEREAVSTEPEEDKEKAENLTNRTTGNKNVVFIYNSHNRESFLPHLPNVTNPNEAHHREVNITKVSDRLQASLKTYGIGSNVDDTDIMNILNQKGWGYGKSYAASRDVVKEAIATNQDIKYVFDLHRDSLGRDKTTKEFNGKIYAKMIFVVGAEYASYEKNLKLATEMHYAIEKKYPGLSRGVLTKKGAGTNGVFNQDISDKAMLIEFGGYDNHLEELYRSADVMAEIFSEFYWDAEKVDTIN